jgi:hypothetical protein
LVGVGVREKIVVAEHANVKKRSGSASAVNLRSIVILLYDCHGEEGALPDEAIPATGRRLLRRNERSSQ